MPAMPAARATPMVAELTVVRPESADSPTSKPEGSRSNRSRTAAITKAVTQVAAPARRPSVRARASEACTAARQADAGGGDRERVGTHRHRADDQDRVRLDHAEGRDHSRDDHEGEIAGDRSGVPPACPSTSAQIRLAPVRPGAIGPISSNRAIAMSSGGTPRLTRKLEHRVGRPRVDLRGQQRMPGAHPGRPPHSSSRRAPREAPRLGSAGQKERRPSDRASGRQPRSSSASPAPRNTQKIAIGLSGDPVPPTIRSGAATNRNSQRRSASHRRARSSNCR